MASLSPLSPTAVVTPPPGIRSNFVDPESLTSRTMGAGIFTLILTALVVIIRLFSNYHATRGLGWDDCSCVIATVILMIYTGTGLDLSKGARHQYDIPPSWFTPPNAKKFYIQSLLVQPMIFFAKLSLLMLYYRLFRPQKFIRYATVLGIAVSFLLYSGLTVGAGIVCAPQVGHSWGLMSEVKCSRGAIVAFILGIVNLVLDIFLLILPLPVVLPLQLSVKKKIGVLTIFMAGLFAFAASIVSLIYRIKLWQERDPAWSGFVCLIWTMIESGVTIICSSTSALVTFWKSHVATYVNVVPLCSRLRACLSKRITTAKIVSSTSCGTQTCHQSDQSKDHSNFSGPYFNELNKHHPKSTDSSESTVRTEIGCGSPASDIEKGVIRTITKMEQSFD